MTKPADAFSVLGALATIAGAGSVANLFEPDLCLHSRVVGGTAADPAAAGGGARRPGRPRRTRARPALGRRRRRAGCRQRSRSTARRGDRGGATERGRGDPVRAGSARLAHAPAPGDVAGRRDQGARRLRRAVLAGRRSRRRGLRARTSSSARSTTTPRRPGAPGCSAPSSRARTRRSVERIWKRRAAGARARRARTRTSGHRRSKRVDVIERDWSEEEWTRGAYAATFGVGGLSRHGPDLTRPVGPIHWAGTDLAGRRPHAHGGRRPLRPAPQHGPCSPAADDR